ncbi:glycosyltransferase family 4 protein [Candidatus Woesearchaeota archaeon]|nr:glycosyltransferase family 4 protein [Candidatus Woesearchaeota archaeon]
MNVLIVAPEFPPSIGGMEVYAAEIAAAVGKSCRLTILTNVSGRHYSPHPFKFRAKVIKLLTGVAEIDDKTILDAAKSEKAQLVHIMNAGLSTAAKGLKQAGISTVITVHGKDFLRSWVFVSRESIRKGLLCSDRIIAVSSMVRERLFKQGIKRNVAVIPHGTDPSLFRHSRKDKALAESLSIPDGNMVLMTCCRVAKKKNIEAVIRLLPELEGATYIVAGPVSDTQYYRELKELASDLGVSERVIFAGAVEYGKLSKYYNLSDIYIMPSIEPTRGDIESFGIAYLEAASCGKPIIASKYAGAADIIKKHKIGFVVDPRNKNQMLRKVKLLLSNKKLRERMGRNGRKLVVKEYNWKNVARKTLHAYKDAIRKKALGKVSIGHNKI